MSKYDYDISKKIAQNDYPFYALIMAAMRQADSRNMIKLERAFPNVWEELQLRYNAPGGMLPAETVRAISREETITEVQHLSIPAWARPPQELRKEI